MSFDLDYLIVDCDHRVVDDVVQEAVDLTSTQVQDGAFFGEAIFGDANFGAASFRLGSYSYGLSGYFMPNVIENTTIAVLPLRFPAANDPQVYVKGATDYLRSPIPEFSYDSYVTEVYYNGYHFFSDGSVYGSDGFEPDPALADNPYVLWKVVYGDPSIFYRVTFNGVDLILPGQTVPGVPGNSLIIARYDNRFSWIVDYNSELSACPKCFGTKTTNDIYVTPRGKLAIVLGTDKLVQSVSKSVLSDRGANPYFPWYGTVIKDLISDNKQQNSFVLRSEIIEQLSRLKDLQLEVEGLEPGYYDPAERLEDIVSIQALTTGDPRAINLRVTVLARTLQQVRSKKLAVIRR